MKRAIRAESGLWWRHSHYVIKNGYIQPGDNAKRESYDPWDQHRRNVSSGKETAYERLFTLLHNARGTSEMLTLRATADTQFSTLSAMEAMRA